MQRAPGKKGKGGLIGFLGALLLASLNWVLTSMQADTFLVDPSWQMGLVSVLILVTGSLLGIWFDRLNKRLNDISDMKFCLEEQIQAQEAQHLHDREEAAAATDHVEKEHSNTKRLMLEYETRLKTTDNQLGYEVRHLQEQLEENQKVEGALEV